MTQLLNSTTSEFLDGSEKSGSWKWNILKTISSRIPHFIETHKNCDIDAAFRYNVSFN